MHQFFAALRGGHGHSHGPEGSCPGHGHGHGGHKQFEITEEMRKAMLKRLEEQMTMMTAAEGNLTRPGRVLYDPNNPGPGPYNKLIFGYGHEGLPPPAGWGSLAPIMPSDGVNEPVAPPVAPVSFEDMIMMHMGPTERDRFWSPTFPVVGRLRIVKDRPGLLQAMGVVLYWLFGNWSTWTAILLPYYADGAVSLSLVLLYAAISILCITSFIRASTLNPGSLNATEKPQADWTECKVCMTMRPPMSHHCRRCGQCVRRMDHHCPWTHFDLLELIGDDSKS